ncbi:alpha/beta hydrolase family protein [Aquimonas sp.]|jgi:dipeptidyl aminopeptidase/acylaminoacyl peptidase|uniref:alpha/beta hydrolase family protein n=1 Tax=Aquimonas sp. TaxID=1872588 RepID=UPI0037C0C595
MSTIVPRAPWLVACALLFPMLAAGETPAVSAAAAPPAIEHFVERDAFFDIKISPDGKHLAANMPVERGSALFMLDTETLQKKGHFYAGTELEVADFWWASNERLLISAAQRLQGEIAPIPTGELFAVNVDGKQSTPLVGYRASDGRVGSLIRIRDNESVWASPIDLLPGEDRQALVQIEPWATRSSSFASIERLDTRNGRRSKLTTSPVTRADFLTDALGNLRFAQGVTTENSVELYHRPAEGGEWSLVNAQDTSGQRAHALGFSTDGNSAYLQVSRSEGPDAIERMDIASGERTEIYRHQRRDPAGPIRTLDRRAVIGVYVREPQLTMHFFEPDHPDARPYRSLAAAFQGYNVAVTSATSDGSKAIVFVFSDRNPGEYFLYDIETKHVRHLGSRGRALEPEQMGSTRAVQIEARDGLQLDALLTLPVGVGEKNLPLVVHPHGGPFDIQDTWGFDPTVQAMATRGYAVLQVNFRGSGGFGSAFVRAGYRQWGQAMQDDLTDATRWAIERGIATAGRICIYGASYGGYASLMGAAKEPDLYACAAGDVGVYDLELMHRRGDVQQVKWGRNYLREALGEEGLREHSPVHLASRIKAPVFLAAGENDRRAPIQHTELMEAALKTAGVPVESLYFRGEGHGYYSVDNKLKFHNALLTFLDRHIGSGWRPQTPAAAAPASP